MVSCLLSRDQALFLRQKLLSELVKILGLQGWHIIIILNFCVFQCFEFTKYKLYALLKNVLFKSPSCDITFLLVSVKFWALMLPTFTSLQTSMPKFWEFWRSQGKCACHPNLEPKQSGDPNLKHLNNGNIANQL